jgi:hypothetical protein
VLADHAPAADRPQAADMMPAIDLCWTASMPEWQIAIADAQGQQGTQS